MKWAPNKGITIKKIFIVVALLIFPILSSRASCTAHIEKAEIVNSEFYINFTQKIEHVLQEHGFDIVNSKDLAEFTFTSKDYITVGSNYFRLQQVNIDFNFNKNNKVDFAVHSLKNCLTVSCPASDYLKALKSSLKKFEQKLQRCQ